MHVNSLQRKLQEAVSKISELTDVLDHLKAESVKNNNEFTTERYYEESAKLSMMPASSAGAGQSSSYAATNPGKSTIAKSDMPTNSQITVTGLTSKLTTTKRR